jgi:hypothetical protein
VSRHSHADGASEPAKRALVEVARICALDRHTSSRTNAHRNSSGARDRPTFALRATVDNLRRVDDVSSRGGNNLRATQSEGWLANRSSLTDAGERRFVDQTGASWNRLVLWLRQVNHLRAARLTSV